MLIMPSFKKSLIVEQFQGNYLKAVFLSMWPDARNSFAFLWISLILAPREHLTIVFPLHITLRKVKVNIRGTFLLSLITAEVRTIAVLLVILLVNWSGAKTIFVEGF